MDSLARLLGSSTRANLVRALAMSGSPLTSYRVARLYNMNMPKTYGEMKNLAALGLVAPSTRRRGVGYRLVDDDLRRLALRLSPRVASLDAWRSEEAKRFRFRAGLVVPPRNPRRASPQRAVSKPTRLLGELLALARLSRRAFDSRYRKLGKRTYGTV